MTTFKSGTQFYGWSNVPTGEEPATLTLKFSVSIDAWPGLPAGTTPISPLDVAEALNGLAAAHGWPPIQFLGTPADEVLNELPA